MSARLQHPSAVPDDAVRRPWPLRATDFDLLGHVNNAATWSVVEDVLASRPQLRAPLWAELEYRAAIEPGDCVELATTDTEGPDGPSTTLWLVEPGSSRLFATARLRPN